MTKISQSNVGNKKRSIFKNIVSKFTKASKDIPSKQKYLFNPELFLTIDEINKKFGKDTVCFGNQFGDLDYDALLNSNDSDLLKQEADKLLKTYRQIDKQLVAFSKVNNTNYNIIKATLLEKQKEKVRYNYVLIRKRIVQLYKV
jgi:hypothetical protein